VVYLVKKKANAWGIVNLLVIGSSYFLFPKSCVHVMLSNCFQ